MVFIIKFRQRYNQKTMVLAGVAIHYRGAVVCTGTVGPQNLPWKRLFQIGHQGLFKTQIAHRFCIKTYFTSNTSANKCKILVLS